MNQLFEDEEFLSKLKVLYVEDSDKLREQTAIFLKKIFIQVSVAEDGEKGWLLAQQNHYDIVITDIKMPKMDGLKMSRNIKKLRPDTQIIITSAYEDIEFLKESIKIGIVDYIVKPIHSKEFLNSILKAVKAIKTNNNLNSMLKMYEKSFESQGAIVFFIKNREISITNKPFLDFFEVKSIEEFASRYGSFESVLIGDDGFLHSEERVSWLDIAIEDSDKIHHVKIKDPSGKKHHFMLRISSFLEEPDEYIVTLEDITELGLLELFESDIYDTDSLKSATDKLRKKLFDQDKKIQKLLTMIRDSSKSLTTLNYYKGLAISHDGEVVDFRREVLRIKVDRFQLKTIINDGYTIIRSDFFPRDIISNLKSFDTKSCEIELDKFRFLANSPSDRRFLRLEVGDEMDIDLQSNHNHILAKVVDISIRSIAIKVRDITHIKERGFVECVINIFPKRYKYKTTIRTSAKVYRVINEDREGEYKVILFLNLDQKSSSTLQEYISKKQLELIKELRSRV